MAAKMAFLAANYQLQVSGDCLVADAVQRNQSRTQEQGIFENFRQKQASGVLMAAGQSKFEHDANRLHKR
jgi:hypothetical protein